MASSTARTLFDRFDQTAVAVVQARPEVDPTLAKEIFEEAATLLHNGIALDHLDDHDAAIDEPDGLHDPAGATLA